MKRLKLQIKWFSILFIIGLSGILALYLGMIRESQDKIMTLQTQMRNYHTVIDYFQQNEAALEHYQQSVDSLEQLKNALEHRIAKESQLPMLLEQTARLFTRQAVTVLAGKPELNAPTPSGEDPLIALPITWKLKGTFLPVVNSLEQMDRLPIKQWPVSFHARILPNDPGQLFVEFQTNIWLRRGKQ